MLDHVSGHLNNKQTCGRRTAALTEHPYLSHTVLNTPRPSVSAALSHSLTQHLTRPAHVTLLKKPYSCVADVLWFTSSHNAPNRSPQAPPASKCVEMSPAEGAKVELESEALWENLTTFPFVAKVIYLYWTETRKMLLGSVKSEIGLLTRHLKAKLLEVFNLCSVKTV